MKLSYVIVAGGFEDSYGNGTITSVEAFTGDLGKKHLPDLPNDFVGGSVFMHNGNVFSLGSCSTWDTSFQLEHGTWKMHGTLNGDLSGESRFSYSAVTTKTAIFIFGGDPFRSKYEYLPKDSKTWLVGKTEIPGGFESGCAIAVKSEQEIWLIGGHWTEKRILSFNVNNHTFKELPHQLNVERRSHQGAIIPYSNKIMITGGFNEKDNRLKSTEVLDPETGSVTMASPMNIDRCTHGMGVMTINDEERLAVFGGYSLTLGLLDCVELYNTQTKSWDTTNIKLSKPMFEFGFLNVKLGDIISQLKSSIE